MSDEQIKQRIRYLVEHGGLYDDPLADIRRTARWAFILAGAAAVFGVVDVLIAVL